MKANTPDRNQAQSGFVLEHVDVGRSSWGFTRHLCTEPEERGVASTLGRYLSQLRASSETSKRGLVAVELAVKKGGAEACGGCGLSVSVASGRRIVVEAGFDAATLQRLVQVLERM
jgi:hypothetical protein